MLHRFGFVLSSIRWVRALGFLLWSAVAFSGVTWGLKWLALDTEPALVSDAALEQVVLDESRVTRVLGGGAKAQEPVQAPEIDPATRFQLVGVINPEKTQGVALISVDGQPAKPFRVGKQVADGYVLQSTQARRVSLGESMSSGRAFMLELQSNK